ncbi:MAG: filamentous hemagglutinin N-terminal domain-containing protein, partial [Cyanobacteria bacterium J06636_16]
YSITGGSTSADDQNLFHSFSEFNLLTGESATFITDPAILNILTRVTGGDPSAIDGLLQVELRETVEEVLVIGRGGTAGNGIVFAGLIDLGSGTVISGGNAISPSRKPQESYTKGGCPTRDRDQTQPFHPQTDSKHRVISVMSVLSATAVSRSYAPAEIRMLLSSVFQEFLLMLL